MPRYGSEIHIIFGQQEQYIGVDSIKGFVVGIRVGLVTSIFGLMR